VGDDQAPVLDQVVQFGLVPLLLQRETLPLRVVRDRRMEGSVHDQPRAA